MSRAAAPQGIEYRSGVRWRTACSSGEAPAWRSEGGAKGPDHLWRCSFGQRDLQAPTGVSAYDAAVVAKSEMTAAETAERAIARLFVAARAGQLAFSALMVASDRRRYKRLWVEVLLLAGTVIESTWLARRLLQAGRYRDRTALLVDAAWSSAGLIVCGSGNVMDLLHQNEICSHSFPRASCGQPVEL